MGRCEPPVSERQLRQLSASGMRRAIHPAPRPPRASSSARATKVRVPLGRPVRATSRVTAAIAAVINSMSTAPRP